MPNSTTRSFASSNACRVRIKKRVRASASRSSRRSSSDTAARSGLSPNSAKAPRFISLWRRRAMSTNSTHKLLPKTQPILIVEDSPDDFEATKRAFGKANLRNEIQHAVSGEDALAHLRAATAKRPGLILLDLNMPGLDGRKTLEIIKKTESLKKIPVVILTTSSDERDVDACYALGANTYVQKPVDFDGLIAAIKRLKEYWFEIALLPKDDGRG